MPTDKTDDGASIIHQAMVAASNSAFEAAIEICLAMDGRCNECCAKAIDDMRRSVCAEVIGSEGEVTH